MSENNSKPSRWTGRAIIGISIIHTLFAAAVFSEVIQAIIIDGLFNTIGEDPMRGAVAWFLFAGFFMALLGLAVDHLEKYGAGKKLSALGLGLIVFSILGIVMMPVSGFWLLLFPAVGMIWNGRTTASHDAS